jgi:hypothetical protein
VIDDVRALLRCFEHRAVRFFVVGARALAVALALLAFASSLSAQNRGRELTLAIGGAVVSRALDRDASGALVVRLGLVQSPVIGRPRARLAVELLSAPLGSGDSTRANRGSISTAGVTYDGLFGPTPEGVRPYAVLGAGASVSGASRADAWPLFLFTARTGFGVRHRVADQELFAELVLASSLGGSGTRAVWWPLTIGFTF